MDIQVNMTENMHEPNTFHMSPPLGIGERLKAAREAMNLSEKDAAARLHLSVRFIEIMETEDFENGPPTIFLRGYLRSYAHLVNLPQKEINDAIERLDINTPKPASAMSTPRLSSASVIDFEPFVRWITYGIVLVLITLVVLWWSSRNTENMNDTSDKETQITPAPSSVANQTTSTPVSTTQNQVPGTPINNSMQPNGVIQNGNVSIQQPTGQVDASQQAMPSTNAPEQMNGNGPQPNPGNPAINTNSQPNATVNYGQLTPDTNGQPATNVEGQPSNNSLPATFQPSDSTSTNNPTGVALGNSQIAPPVNPFAEKSESNKPRHRHHVHMDMAVPEPGLF